MIDRRRLMFTAAAAWVIARIGLQPLERIEETAERIAAGDISPAPMSLARTPTLSLPIGFAPDGLPYGFQLAGAPFTESMLCRVGQAYESATRWYTRHPVA